jgi:hypothetical protein
MPRERLDEGTWRELVEGRERGRLRPTNGREGCW